MKGWESLTVLPNRLVAAIALGCCLAAMPASEARAGQLRQKGSPGDASRRPRAEASVAPGEIQQLFDTLLVRRAQKELELSDAQYPQFLSRVGALQDVRHRSQAERMRLLRALRQLAYDGKAGEAETRSQIQALDELDRRTAEQIRRATEEVDEILDVRQQARFRVLQEQIERRKVELLSRARQPNRTRP
jgi:hypothetical protein